jgi:hypothetical protein
MVKVGVISDWARAGRGNAWELLLSELNPAPEVTVYPIADLIVAPVVPVVERQGLLQNIHKERVLIINWDAANGDPEFGGQLCQRWLEHRRPEIIQWVYKGGVLLIESQTTLGTPCQAAYDAAVGKGELPTSGLDDPTNPLKSLTTRSGKAARKTSRFPKDFGFGAVDERIVARNAYPDVKPFPDTTTGLLIEALRNVDPGPFIWRGVFRKPLRGREFPWVSIMETADGSRFRQSVMQVAKLGSGAIFATTMMLAMTGQHELVGAIIRCPDGNTGHLPSPVAAVERAKTGVKVILPILVGLAPLYWKFDLPAWLKVLFVPLGIAVVIAVTWLYGRSRRFVRNILGY